MVYGYVGEIMKIYPSSHENSKFNKLVSKAAMELGILIETLCPDYKVRIGRPNDGTTILVIDIDNVSSWHVKGIVSFFKEGIIIVSPYIVIPSPENEMVYRRLIRRLQDISSIKLTRVPDSENNYELEIIDE